MNPLYGNCKLSLAEMYLLDLEAFRSGDISRFSRMVDGRGAGLGSESAWKDRVREILGMDGIESAEKYINCASRAEAMGIFPQQVTSAPKRDTRTAFEIEMDSIWAARQFWRDAYVKDSIRITYDGNQFLFWNRHTMQPVAPTVGLIEQLKKVVDHLAVFLLMDIPVGMEPRFYHLLTKEDFERLQEQCPGKRISPLPLDGGIFPVVLKETKVGRKAK